MYFVSKICPTHFGLIKLRPVCIMYGPLEHIYVVVFSEEMMWAFRVGSSSLYIKYSGQNMSVGGGEHSSI